MAAIVDLGTQLMPQADYTGNQSFPALQCYPRDLATTAWIIHITTAPTASCLFVLASSVVSTGPFVSVQSFPWPVGDTGRHQIPVGLGGHLVQVLGDPAATWLRMSVATAGTFSGMSWLGKPMDGGPGLGSRSYALDGVSPLASPAFAAPLGQTAQAAPARQRRHV